jgi:hypothetical protein
MSALLARRPVHSITPAGGAHLLLVLMVAGGCRRGVGSRWSARSEARTNDLYATPPRRMIAGGEGQEGSPFTPLVADSHGVGSMVSPLVRVCDPGWIAPGARGSNPAPRSCSQPGSPPGGQSSSGALEVPQSQEGWTSGTREGEVHLLRRWDASGVAPTDLPPGGRNRNRSGTGIGAWWAGGSVVSMQIVVDI